jgi:2'-5' RNA ligase
MPPSDLQASLEGFAAPRPTDRLFFAVVPPAPVAERIATLARELRGRLGLRGHPRPTTHLHVTLHHLGDFAGVPAAVVEDARLAAAGVAMAPLEARFDRAGSFRGRSGRHPFVLLGEEASRLGELHARLGDRLAAMGLGRRERAFVPHVTLLYDAHAVATSPSEPLGWPVHDFVLIHSLLGRTEYRELGRWPLGPPQR